MSLVLGCSEPEDDTFDGTFAAWGSSTSSVSLLWLPVEGASGYTLERIGGDTVTLGADQVQYLDRGLAEGTYTYRLTPIGGEPVEAEATTSEDPATVTGDDAPIGEPVIATIGSAGGMIELPAGRARAIVPPGALPDGATVTLQEIAAPTGAGDVAVDIVSEPAFTGAIDIAFALAEDDLAGGNIAIADKQADGTWVTADARVEGDRAIVKMIVPAELHAGLATPPGRNRFVRFRRIRIDPDPVLVRANQERALFAQAVFSDDICQDERHVAFCQLAVGPHNDAFQPLRSPIVDPRRVRNDLGTWALGGPGSLHAVPDEHSATYFAPASKPTRDRWLVTFTTRGATPMRATSMIRFIDDVFLIEIHYHNASAGISMGYADVTDMFYALVRVNPNGAAVIIGGPYNQTTTVTNVRPGELFSSVTLTSPLELATVTSGAIENVDGSSVSMTFMGSSVTPSAVGVYKLGGTLDWPGSTPAFAVGLTFANVRLLDITSEQWFTYALDPSWRMKVAASPGP